MLCIVVGNMPVLLHFSVDLVFGEMPDLVYGCMDFTTVVSGMEVVWEGIGCNWPGRAFV